MNADRLLEYFERISDAADVVPRLRRFVLDLAVRGRLVAQDPADLSFRIAASSDKVSQEPFPVPSAWQWIPFGSIHALVRGVTYTKSDVGEAADRNHVAILRANNIGIRINQDDLVYVNRRCVSENQMLREGDFLIALSSGSKNLVGKAALVDGHIDAAFGGFCGAIRLSHSDLHPFVRLFLASPLYREAIASGSRGIGINNLKRSTLDAIPFPLPPLAEQHRIVTKVDELMALCDRLEAAQAEREARRDRLVSASLPRVTESDSADATSATASARFHLDHLARLTTRPEQVKQLRQTILNLAVRGRLVPKDPADAPVASLVHDIANAKADLRAKTGDHRIRPALTPEQSKLPFPIPGHWTAESFENLFLFIDYRGKTPPKTAEGIPLITAKNIRMGFLNREPREFISSKTFASWMSRGSPLIGDVFFTTEAPLANVCLNTLDEPFALAQRVVCLQPYGDVDTKFIMFAVMSPLMQCVIDAHATGTTARGIKTAKLKPLPIPLPPLAEQRRIVAKVDELMALCDQLEASLASTAKDRARLLEALLHEALEPAA